MNAGCPGWKSLCGNNAYVKRNCKKSCNTCEGVVTTPTTTTTKRPVTTTKRPVTTKAPKTKTTKGPVIPSGGI